MATAFPGITISVGHSSSRSEAQGDLNSLSVGNGLFLAWVYIVIFQAGLVFVQEALPTPSLLMPTDLSLLLFDSFMLSIATCLLIEGLTDQLFLRFYVGRNALILATVLACTGTFLVCATQLQNSLATVFAGVLMGAGASLLTVLWGTAFARFEFPTILLNTAIAVIMGVCICLVFVHWIPSPLSGILVGVFPILSSVMLWQFTPMPYYTRKEIPVFHPLPIHRKSFIARAGLPILLFGFILGGMRRLSMGWIIPQTDIGSQLVIIAASFLALIAVILTLAASGEQTNWDMPFRCLVPIVGLGLFFIPLAFSEYALVGGLFVAVGFICLDSLLWFFFSSMSEEFRLSPIFMFGVGRSLIALGAVVGANMMMRPPMSILPEPYGNTGTVLLMLLALAAAYALLPRQREIKSLVDPAYPVVDRGNQELKADLDTFQEQESGMIEQENAEEIKREKGRFHTRCEEIADRYMLSRRETEVMFLLAKGHNAAFIQNKLCVSKSTAKTHINHIYRKLDIHTQQELLNMVEDPKASPDASAAGDAAPQETPTGAASVLKAAAARTDIFKSHKKA